MVFAVAVVVAMVVAAVVKVVAVVVAALGYLRANQGVLRAWRDLMVPGALPLLCRTFLCVCL